jgi:hypothetical protein
MSPTKMRPHQLLSAACRFRSSPGERGLVLKTDSTPILRATVRNFRWQIDAYDEREYVKALFWTTIDLLDQCIEPGFASVDHSIVNIFHQTASSCLLP